MTRRRNASLDLSSPCSSVPPFFAEGGPVVVRVRFLRPPTVESPTSVVAGHIRQPVGKYVPISQVPPICITLVECALQHARKACPVLLADDAGAFLFTTHPGQEANLLTLSDDLRLKLDQAWTLGCGMAAEVELISTARQDFWTDEVTDQNW